MKAMGIKAQIRKKRKNYNSVKPEEVAENLLSRNFHADRPNEKWATDVTEFKIPGTSKKLYLSAIIDLYDRSVVSFVIKGRNDNRLVFDTFKKAVEAHPEARPLFHSDRGFQYTSKVFKAMINEHHMRQSMSRVGHCIDNGPTEGLWGIIKSELYMMYKISDEKSLIKAIEEYIDYYNNGRLQERFKGQTPSEVRLAALKAISDNEAPEDYPIPDNKRIAKYWETIRLKQASTASA